MEIRFESLLAEAKVFVDQSRNLPSLANAARAVITVRTSGGCSMLSCCSAQTLLCSIQLRG